MNEKTLQLFHILVQISIDAEKSLSETWKQAVIEFDEYDSKFKSFSPKTIMLRSS